MLLLQFGLLFWLVASDRERGIAPRCSTSPASSSRCSPSRSPPSRKRERRIAVALAVAAIAFSGGALSGLRPFNLDAGPLLAVVFSAYATWVLLVGIVRSRRVTGDVLAGALAAYIMAGLAFAVVYGVIEAPRPARSRRPAPCPRRFPTSSTSAS